MINELAKDNINKLSQAMVPLREISDINDQIELQNSQISRYMYDANNINSKKIRIRIFSVLCCFWAKGLVGIPLVRVIGENLVELASVLIVAVCFILFYIPWDRKHFGGFQNEINICREKINVMENQISVIYLNNKETIDFPPPNYRHYHAVKFFKEVLENERADTMKEAINIYEVQLHNWKMENYQQEVIARQQEHSDQLNNIERNSRIAAVAGSVAAMSNTY